MLTFYGKINNDFNCSHVSAMWGAMWEAREATSLPLQARQLQLPRLDFITQLEEWMRKDNAAVRMQSCFRGWRGRQVAPLRVPYDEPFKARACAPEACDVVPPPPPDSPAASPPPSGSPSEPADSTAEVRAVGAPTLAPNP